MDSLVHLDKPDHLDPLDQEVNLDPKDLLDLVESLDSVETMVSLVLLVILVSEANRDHKDLLDPLDLLDLQDLVDLVVNLDQEEIVENQDVMVRVLIIVQPIPFALTLTIHFQKVFTFSYGLNYQFP